MSKSILKKAAFILTGTSFLLLLFLGLYWAVNPHVEYYGNSIPLRELNSQQSELHCVQKPVPTWQEVLISILPATPPLICFDTISEADEWIAQKKKG